MFPAGQTVSTLRLVRSALLALVGFGTAGMSTELLLIGHYEDSLQVIPLVTAAFALALIALVAVRPTTVPLRAFQFLMLTYIATGITGMTLHFNANAEFQREIDPSLAGLPLF